MLINLFLLLHEFGVSVSSLITEIQDSMQDSSFVQLIIYLPFYKGLYPIFNMNISKVLFTISFSSSGWLSEVFTEYL